jgi:hypothetical protein
VQIEEVEDEYWIMEASMPKARLGIIEDADPLEETLIKEDAANDATQEGEEKLEREVDSVSWESLPPPTAEAEPIVL